MAAPGSPFFRGQSDACRLTTGLSRCAQRRIASGKCPGDSPAKYWRWLRNFDECGGNTSGKKRENFLTHAFPDLGFECCDGTGYRNFRSGTVPLKV